jgi:hypothetical protein
MSAQALHISQPSYRIWWRVKATADAQASPWYRMMLGNKDGKAADQEIDRYSAKHPEREYCKLASDWSPP